jgi:hypothetical protein
MTRSYLLLGVGVLLSTSLACKKQEYPEPVIVHVLRDPSASFAKNLRQADLQFALSKARLNSGKGMIIATNEGDSYRLLLRRLACTPQDLLILNSPSDLPDNAEVRAHTGKLQPVCGEAPAYIPDWVSGEKPEATEMYLRFLIAHCEASKSP